MRLLLIGTILLFALVVNAQNRTCQVPTISVTGRGIVYGTPDMATFTVNIETRADTSAVAAQTTNSKMAQVVQVLNSNNIPAADIQTTALSISPQYNYSQSYPYPIIGQTASTSINVKVRRLPADGSSVGTLYDQLSNIDGVTINGLAFDIQNKTSLRRSARAQAYQQAQGTASQFASFSGYRLGTPQSINEQAIERPIEFGRVAYDSAFGGAAPSVSTAVVTGSFVIELSTDYTFYLL